MDIEKELVNLNQNKMTAVETLLDWLRNNHYYIGNDLLEKVEELKEIEKQQIIDAVEWGNRKGYDEHTLTCIYDEDLKYYNETFNKE